MPFQDLADLLAGDQGGLPLPYAGKVYRIPPIDAATGLWCQQILARGVRVVGGKLVADEDAAGTELLDDDGELTLYRRLLGPVHGEMVADGVLWDVVKVAALTVFWDAVAGRETAERWWNSAGAGLGEAAAPANRKARRATTRATSAGATTTKRQASTTGTSASKATPKPAAPRSAGGRSSRTGT